MVILYRTSDGRMLDNTGTNSIIPTGPENLDILLKNMPRRFGGELKDYSACRLHDVEQSDIVNRILCGCDVYVWQNRIYLKDVEKKEVSSEIDTPESLMSELEKLHSQAQALKVRLERLLAGVAQ